MKTTEQIKNEIFIIGATRRLEELNKERDYLIRIIKHNSSVPNLIINTTISEKESKNTFTNNERAEKVEKVHWTQTPEGRAKMSRIQKKILREGRSGLIKAQKNRAQKAKNV